jgi:hypothetical protein
MTSGVKSPVTIQQFSDHNMNVSTTGNVLQAQGIIFTAKLQNEQTEKKASTACLFHGFLSSLRKAIIASLNRQRERVKIFRPVTMYITVFLALDCLAVL